MSVSQFREERTVLRHAERPEIQLCSTSNKRSGVIGTGSATPGAQLCSGAGSACSTHEGLSTELVCFSLLAMKGSGWAHMEPGSVVSSSAVPAAASRKPHPCPKTVIPWFEWRNHAECRR